jgi:hypothetical protein
VLVQRQMDFQIADSFLSEIQRCVTVETRTNRASILFPGLLAVTYPTKSEKSTSTFTSFFVNSVFKDIPKSILHLHFTSEQLARLYSNSSIQLLHSMTSSSAQDGTGVVNIDPWLKPFTDSLRHRYSAYQKWVDTINQHEGGLENFSRGYEKMGFQVMSNGEIIYREWAPNATSAHLFGDFSMSFINMLTRQLGS